MSVLAPNEAQDLHRLEATISSGLQTFRSVGEALLEIRDRRLYRAAYASFAAYVEQKWNITARHAHRMVFAEQVRKNTGVAVTERQARELSGLTPDQQRDIVGGIATDGDAAPPSASEIRKAVQDSRATIGSRLAEIDTLLGKAQRLCTTLPRTVACRQLEAIVVNAIEQVDRMRNPTRKL